MAYISVITFYVQNVLFWKWFTAVRDILLLISYYTTDKKSKNCRYPLPSRINHNKIVRLAVPHPKRVPRSVPVLVVRVSLHAADSESRGAMTKIHENRVRSKGLYIIIIIPDRTKRAISRHGLETHRLYYYYNVFTKL